MKAAVYKGNRRIVVEDIPTPSPGPGQVLVRVRLCAICGTDVHAYMYDAPRPGTVMGHEYCGTIAAVGEGVTTWSEGDRVVGGGGMAPAGSLPSFKGARFNYRTMGFDAKPVRAYAEYVLMEEWEPLGVPDGVSDEDAALCEPLAVAVHAVRRSAVKLGDSVAVLGGGPIGLFTAQAARAAGAPAGSSYPSPRRREPRRPWSSARTPWWTQGAAPPSRRCWRTRTAWARTSCSTALARHRPSTRP